MTVDTGWRARAIWLRRVVAALLFVAVLLLIAGRWWIPDATLPDELESVHGAGAMEPRQDSVAAQPASKLSRADSPPQRPSIQTTPGLSAVDAISVQSAAQLQALVDAFPDDPDVMSSVAMVLDVCDDPRLEKDISMADLIEHMERKGHGADASYLRQTSLQFCNHTLHLPQSLYGDDIDIWRSGNMLAALPDLAQLQQVVAAMPESGDVDADSAAAMVAVAGELMATSGSFHVFREAGELLIAAGQFNAFVDQSGWADIGHVRGEVARAGLLLAGCTLFGGCAPHQLWAINQCIHGGCDPAAHPSVEELVLDRIAPRDLRQAQRVVEMLLWLRGAGG